MCKFLGQKVRLAARTQQKTTRIFVFSSHYWFFVCYRNSTATAENFDRKKKGRIGAAIDNRLKYEEETKRGAFECSTLG